MFCILCSTETILRNCLRWSRDVYFTVAPGSPFRSRAWGYLKTHAYLQFPDIFPDVLHLALMWSPLHFIWTLWHVSMRFEKGSQRKAFFLYCVWKKQTTARHRKGLAAGRHPYAPFKPSYYVNVYIDLNCDQTRIPNLLAYPSACFHHRPEWQEVHPRVVGFAPRPGPGLRKGVRRPTLLLCL